MIPVANHTAAPPPETEVTEEQEQNTIARALALHYGKEGPLPSLQLSQPSQAPIGTLHPVRLRSLPLREGLHTGTGTIGQYQSGSWDMSADQRHHRSQAHSNSVTKAAPGYRSVGPPRVSAPVTLRDVSGMSREGISREALAKSRAVAGCIGSYGSRAAPVRTVSHRRDRHEVQVPVDEHQQDEDNWLRGESSMPDIDSRSESSEADHGSAVVHGSYNPMSWSGSANWWGSMRSPSMTRMPGAAMPVRLRPAVTVCAAPPPRRSEPEDPENEGEAATRKVLSQLSL